MIKIWLEKPFPFYENYQQKIFIPVFFTLAVILGLILLNYSNNKNIFIQNTISILEYGVVIIVISLFFSLILPELFPKLFDSENWNIKKTLIFITASIIGIGFTVGIFAFYKEQPQTTMSLFMTKIFIRSIVLSILPIIILIFIAERYLFKKNHMAALEMVANFRMANKSESTKTEFTFAENTKDKITINENNLYFIKAEANYSLLHFNKNNTLEKQLIRSSLKNIEKILSISDTFIRCHKSYIVNLNKVIKVTGNAKGYVFYLSENNFKIPVSRNISKSILETIKNKTY